MNSQAQHKIIVHGANKPGQYTWSPFVTKLEFRLRLSNLPYQHGTGSPFSAPKGKIPYVELPPTSPGAPSESLGDTTLITRELIARGMLLNLNIRARLGASEIAHDLAIRAMLEDKLFFYNARERWVDNFYTMRDYAMAGVPFPLRTFFGYMAYRGNVRKLQDQGTGRFSDDEVRDFRRDIWEAVNGLLEDSRRKAGEDKSSGNCFWVLGGSEPTEADATMFGFAVSALMADAAPESRQLVTSEMSAVMEYATRIHNRYFPDYHIWK
jgi:hypothetical protein